jgi:hypothetical protein
MGTKGAVLATGIPLIIKASYHLKPKQLPYFIPFDLVRGIGGLNLYSLIAPNQGASIARDFAAKANILRGRDYREGVIMGIFSAGVVCLNHMGAGVLKLGRSLYIAYQITASTGCNKHMLPENSGTRLDDHGLGWAIPAERESDLQSE